MKKTVIGLDIGGSTTKIVGWTGKELIAPMFVSATDPLTSAYGAFGKFTSENGIALSDIECVRMTGVGSAYINPPIYGVPCVPVSEFTCAGLGGLYSTGLDRAIVVSMGTGTALIYAQRGKEMRYLGGTGVGGGTLMGLSKKLLGVDTMDSIIELASGGDLGNIDLMISDITRPDLMPGMAMDMTASNFGKVSDLASKEDLALGIFNMVFESIGMLAVFASRQFGVRDIVLTGNLSAVPQAKKTFDGLNQLFDVNFTIPENAGFATVIGAAISGEAGKKKKKSASV